MLSFAGVLVVFAIVSGLYTLYLYHADRGKRRVARRAKRISGQRADKIKRTSSGARLRQEHGPLDALARRLMRRPDTLRARLGSGGIGISIGRYLVTCAVITLATIALTSLKGLSPVMAVVVGLIVGVGMPHLWVERRIGKRRIQFFKLFPETISLMVRGLKAGLPFADTLTVVAREISDPVGEEFRRISDQIRLGQSVEEAMWTVSRRIELPEFDFLITTLSVQRETGGNLAATLENLEDMLRKRQQIRLKVKAMSSEAKASAAIIGCLPFLMATILYVVSPEYVGRLFTSHAGHVMLGMGTSSLLAGVYMMSRMVRFEL